MSLWTAVRKSLRGLLLIFGIIFSTTPFLYPLFVFVYPLSVVFKAPRLLHVLDHLLFEWHVRLVLFVFLYFGGTEVSFYGDAKEVFQRKENVLYFSNHQTGVDWIVAAIISVRHGFIHQLRYIMKHSLLWMPFYGWICYLHRCIFVHRGNFNQKEMEENLENLKNLPFWLVIYPEGTRYDPQASNQKEQCEVYAKENGLPILNHLLTPRSRGVTTILKHLRSKMDAVYDITIFYERCLDQSGKRVKAPEFVDYLRFRKNRLHIHIRRIPLSTVPTTDEEIKMWLYDAFVQKDKIIDAFIRKTYGQNSEEDKTLLRWNEDIPTRERMWRTFPAFICWIFLFYAFVWNSTVRILYLVVTVIMIIQPLFIHLKHKSSSKQS